MILTHDWKGRPIYEDDDSCYFDTEEGLVPDEEYEAYQLVKTVYGEPLSMKEIIENARYLVAEDFDI